MKKYEEIVHAHWICHVDKVAIRCSFCDQPMVGDAATGNPPRCCNCGAFMDEPEEYVEGPIGRKGTIRFDYSEDSVSAHYAFHSKVSGHGGTKSEAKNNLLEMVAKIGLGD